MKRYLILILIAAVKLTAGQCTFEQFHYKYYPSKAELVKTIPLKDNGILLMTSGFIDSPYLTRALISTIRLDSCGKIAWHTSHGQASGNYAYDILETDSGNLLSVGFYDNQHFALFKQNKDGVLTLYRPYSIGEATWVRNITRRDGRNTFLLSGKNAYQNATISKSFIMEVDENGKVIRSKQFDLVPNWNGDIVKVFSIEDSYFIISTLSTQSEFDYYLTKTDTLFNVISNRNLAQDSITEFDALHFQASLSFDKKSLIIGGDIAVLGPPKVIKNRMAKFTLEGTLEKLVKLPDTLNPTSIAATKDGGYVLGGYLTKLDKDFNIEWVKDLITGGARSVYQNHDGTYVGGGVSDRYGPEPLKQWHLYLVKTDSMGNHAPPDTVIYPPSVGIKEPTETAEFLIYPNPANEQIAIEGTEIQGALLYIRDYNGRLVMKDRISEDRTNINVRELSSGFYFIELTDVSGKKHERKIAITR